MMNVEKIPAEQTSILSSCSTSEFFSVLRASRTVCFCISDSVSDLTLDSNSPSVLEDILLVINWWKKKLYNKGVCNAIILEETEKPELIFFSVFKHCNFISMSEVHSSAIVTEENMHLFVCLFVIPDIITSNSSKTVYPPHEGKEENQSKKSKVWLLIKKP